MNPITTVPPVILFWGPEDYLIKRRLAEIVQSVTSEDGSEPEIISLHGSETEARELGQYLAEVSLFAHRRLVILRYPVWTGKGRKGADKGFEYVIKSFVQNRPDHLHLLITADQSPTGSLADVIKKWGEIIAVPELNPRQLSHWITSELAQAGVKIDREALNILVKCGRDMNYLAQEMARLSLCHRGETVAPRHLTGIESDLADFTVFKLTDALLRREGTEAVKALANLLQKGEPAPLILHMITRELVLLGKVQALAARGLTAAEISSRLGKQPFRVEKMLSSTLRKHDLRPIFDQLAEVDFALKNTAQDHRLLLETLMVEICEPPG